MLLFEIINLHYTKENYQKISKIINYQQNTNSPTALVAKFLGDNLNQVLGQVSGAHIRSIEEFADVAKCCTTEDRILSLDVVNLFSSIPRDKKIKFL